METELNGKVLSLTDSLAPPPSYDKAASGFSLGAVTTTSSPPSTSVTATSAESEGAGRLLHNYKQSLDHKDFTAEIRGLLDVRGLLEKCSVLLDVEDRPNTDPSTSSLESIVDTMLASMMVGTAETVSKGELKSLIFANSEMDLLSNTVQALEEGEINQNWLCSATEVPGLTRRMIGIARMSENTNMGEGANEVKFFILILCPANIKGKYGHSYGVVFSLYNNVLWPWVDILPDLCIQGDRVK